MDRIFAATDYGAQKSDYSSFFDESQNRNDNLTKKRKGGDETSEFQSKKRFVWPDYLHKQFISAVFDVGLKFATVKELSEIISTDESPSLEQTKSFIQKFRSFRNFNVDSNVSTSNLQKYNTSSDNLNQVGSIQQQQQSGQPIPSQTYFGESIGDDRDDYQNSHDIELNSPHPSTLSVAPTLVMAPPDVPVDRQLLDSLLSEIGMIGTSITAQTGAVQEMGRSIVKQMRLYSQLVDTLAEIDPAASAAYTNNPSYINHDNGGGMSAGIGSLVNSQSNRSISQFSPRGSSSNLQGLARNFTSHRTFSLGQSPTPVMRRCASRDSMQSFEGGGVTSDQIISGMKMANTSPLDVEGYHLRATLPRSNSVASNKSDSEGGTDGNTRRTELHAIYEMRAQMDLHRRLFEWKEDQVLIATAAAAAIADPQQQQQYIQHMMLDQQNMHFPPSLNGEQFSTMTDADGLSYRVHPTLSNGNIVYVQQGGPLMVSPHHPFASSLSFTHSSASSSGGIHVSNGVNEQVARERAFSCEILYDPSLERLTASNSLYLDASSTRGSDHSLMSATHGAAHHNQASVFASTQHHHLDGGALFADSRVGNSHSNSSSSSTAHNDYALDHSDLHAGSSGTAWDDDGALDDFEADLFSFLVDGSDCV